MYQTEHWEQKNKTETKESNSRILFGLCRLPFSWDAPASVYGHYILCLHQKQNLGTNLSPITLDEIDPQSDLIVNIEDPIFNKEDLAWIGQIDLEANVVAKA